MQRNCSVRIYTWVHKPQRSLLKLGRLSMVVYSPDLGGGGYSSFSRFSHRDVKCFLFIHTRNTSVHRKHARFLRENQIPPQTHAHRVASYHQLQRLASYRYWGRRQDVGLQSRVIRVAVRDELEQSAERRADGSRGKRVIPHTSLFCLHFCEAAAAAAATVVVRGMFTHTEVTGCTERRRRGRLTVVGRSEV